MDQCPCGKIFIDRKGGFKKHEKSKQHNQWLYSLLNRRPNE
jgi:hypothetical protein